MSGVERRVSRWRGVTTLVALAAIGLSGAAAAQEPETRPDVQPPARIAVSPGKFEVPIGPQPVVESLKLINFGDSPVDIRVSLASWDLDDNSRVRLLESGEQTLDQWMLVNPRTFTVEAGGEQTVRFSIRPRQRPSEGEHRAMIYFEEVPGARSEEKPVQVRFKLGVAVYAHAGDVERAGRLNELRVAADPRLLRADFDISSVGNVHVRMRGQYAIWPADAFPGLDAIGPFEGLDRPDFRPPAPALLVGALPNTPVLAGTRRALPLVGGHGLPAGRYVLTALGELGPGTIREAVEFTIPAAEAAESAAIGRIDS